MNLSANQERAVMEKKRLVWRVEGSFEEQSKAVRGRPVDPTKLVVELAPMEIRTFVIEFYSKRYEMLYELTSFRECSFITYWFPSFVGNLYGEMLWCIKPAELLALEGNFFSTIMLVSGSLK